MPLEAGDEYDCPACGRAHAVKRGKDLQVPGSSEPLEAGVYVRCPAAGVFDPETGPAGTTDSDGDGSAEQRWP